MAADAVSDRGFQALIEMHGPCDPATKLHIFPKFYQLPLDRKQHCLRMKRAALEKHLAKVKITHFDNDDAMKRHRQNLEHEFEEYTPGTKHLYNNLQRTGIYLQKLTNDLKLVDEALVTLDNEEAADVEYVKEVEALEVAQNAKIKSEKIASEEETNECEKKIESVISDNSDSDSNSDSNSNDVDDSDDDNDDSRGSVVKTEMVKVEYDEMFSTLDDDNDSNDNDSNDNDSNDNESNDSDDCFDSLFESMAARNSAGSSDVDELKGLMFSLASPSHDDDRRQRVGTSRALFKSPSADATKNSDNETRRSSRRRTETARAKALRQLEEAKNTSKLQPDGATKRIRRRTNVR
jgi:hypothetical protein